MKTRHDKEAHKLGHKTINGVCIDAEKHTRKDKALMIGSHTTSCGYGGECPCHEIKTQHTPTPWTAYPQMLGNGKAGDNINIFSSVGVAIPVTKENAEFIIRAVNSHEELLELVKEMKWIYESGINYSATKTKRINKVIAKAEGL